MAELTVNTARMSSAVTAEHNVAKKLDALGDEIASVQRNLSFNVKSRAQINLQLVTLKKVCDTNANRVRRLSTTLQDAIENYSATERRVSGNATGGKAVKKPSGGKTDSPKTLWDKFVNWYRKQFEKDPNGTIIKTLPFIGLLPIFGVNIGFLPTIMNGGVPVIKGTKTVNGKVFGLPAALTAEGELFGFSGKKELKTNFDFKNFDPKKKSVSIIEGTISGEAHVAQGSVKGNIGLLSTEAKGTVGQVSGEGTIGIGLYKDGKLAPSLQAKLKAEAVGLKGELKQQFGTDEFNVHRKAEGSLGVARAEASGEVGVITYEREDGTIATDVGAHGKAGAIACAAEGKASGGFTIFGVKVDVGVSGKAGAIGATAEGRIGASGVSGEIGGALGIGGGLKLSIDWSGLFKKK